MVPINYKDSDYAGDINDSKSTSGYVFMFDGGAIFWACKRQKYVSQCTMEAEFVASSLAITEAIWIKGFLANLKLEVITDEHIQLLCDNQTIVYIF